LREGELDCGVDTAAFAPFDLDALFEHAPYSRPIRKRLGKALRALADRPADSFPEALGPAGYRALTRLWQNPRVRERLPFDEVFDATAARLPKGEDVVVVHDTTDFVFPALGVRLGLEPLAGDKARFRGHLSLAVSVGEERAVFGPLAFEALARTSPVAAGQSSKQRYDAPDKESLRWWRGIEAAEACAVGPACLIHVADREADDDATQCRMAERGGHDVQRLRQSRVLAHAPAHAPDAHKVADALGTELVVRATREVARSKRLDAPKRRQPGLRTRFPAREARTARLEVRAVAVTLQRPGNAPPSLPPSLTVNVVHVRESEPPAGEEPVVWVLLTSEPIGTEAEVLRVVDLYRRRWVIEEFFKALKTGCAYESRQLESLHALLVALALFLPLATDLLNLRAIAEEGTEVPADAVRSEAEVEVLAADAGCAPEALTASEALRRVARLGGHLTHNGRPGWQVLWRGLKRLREQAVGWQAARAALARSQGKKVTNR
jgi:Transposase DDE domain